MYSPFSILTANGFSILCRGSAYDCSENNLINKIIYVFLLNVCPTEK